MDLLCTTTSRALRITITTLLLLLLLEVVRESEGAG
jgi:hypothetical protein